MKSITVCLASLYEKFHGHLANGVIEKSYDGETEYYDLFVNDSLVCMDGETCTILHENKDSIVLLNDYGEKNSTFTLSTDELSVINFN